jgi:hypothetical protein
MLNRTPARHFVDRFVAHGPLLGIFASAIHHAASTNGYVNVETQFGELAVDQLHSLADVVDTYDAMRDAASAD